MNFSEVRETACLDLAKKFNDIVKPSATSLTLFCLEPDTIKKKEKVELVKPSENKVNKLGGPHNPKKIKLGLGRLLGSL